MDFAITKDRSASPPRYTVFFKARDADALTAAFSEFGNHKMKKQKRPSVLQMLRNLQEKAKSVVAPVREKKQERER